MSYKSLIDLYDTVEMMKEANEDLRDVFERQRRIFERNLLEKETALRTELWQQFDKMAEERKDRYQERLDAAKRQVDCMAEKVEFLQQQLMGRNRAFRALMSKCKELEKENAELKAQLTPASPPAAKKIKLSRESLDRAKQQEGNGQKGQPQTSKEQNQQQKRQLIINPAPKMCQKQPQPLIQNKQATHHAQIGSTSIRVVPTIRKHPEPPQPKQAVVIRPIQRQGQVKLQSNSPPTPVVPPGQQNKKKIVKLTKTVTLQEKQRFGDPNRLKKGVKVANIPTHVQLANGQIILMSDWLVMQQKYQRARLQPPSARVDKVNHNDLDVTNARGHV